MVDMCIGSLFPPSEEEQRAARNAQLDNQVEDLLLGRTAFAITDVQREILRLLRHRRGHARAVKASELADKVGVALRVVNDQVRSLVVDFKLQVGASRDGADGGYYLVMTEQEAEDSARPYIEVAMALLRRAKVLIGTRAILDLRGHLSIEDEQQHTEAH